MATARKYLVAFYNGAGLPNGLKVENVRPAVSITHPRVLLPLNQTTHVLNVADAPWITRSQQIMGLATGHTTIEVDWESLNGLRCNYPAVILPIYNVYGRRMAVPPSLMRTTPRYPVPYQRPRRVIQPVGWDGNAAKLLTQMPSGLPYWRLEDLARPYFSLDLIGAWWMHTVDSSVQVRGEYMWKQPGGYVTPYTFDCAGLTDDSQPVDSVWTGSDAEPYAPIDFPDATAVVPPAVVPPPSAPAPSAVIDLTGVVSQLNDVRSELHAVRTGIASLSTQLSQYPTYTAALQQIYDAMAVVNGSVGAVGTFVEQRTPSPMERRVETTLLSALANLVVK